MTFNANGIAKCARFLVRITARQLAGLAKGTLGRTRYGAILIGTNPLAIGTTDVVSVLTLGIVQHARFIISRTAAWVELAVVLGISAHRRTIGTCLQILGTPSGFRSAGFWTRFTERTRRFFTATQIDIC